MIFRPDVKRGLECHVDADFAGNWDIEDHMSVDTARSRHGYIITYAGCPLLWASQLQHGIALSITESEYNGLSRALRDAIPIMNLLREMKSRKLPVTYKRTKIHCKVFEDNSGAITMATTKKFRPRTKHVNIKMHHFREYVDNGSISVHHIGTEDQPADISTKPTSREVFEKHKKNLIGW